MKNIPCILLLACAAIAPLAGAPAGYEKIERATFLPAAGKWGDAQNWSTKALPEGNVSPLIASGKSATIDCPVNVTSTVYLGSKAGGMATLSIVDGAKASLGSLSVHPGLKGVSGFVRMSGGALSVGADKDRRGLLMVGAGGTFSGTAVMEVSGGRIEGGITVGSRFPQTQVGTLSVVGSQPVITGKDKVRCYFLLNPSGTLQFVLDDKGVAPLNFGGKSAIFIAGGKILVDGSQYKGGAQKLPLIIAGKFEGAPPPAEIAHFPAGLSAEVAAEGATLFLKITKSSQ